MNYLFTEGSLIVRSLGWTLLHSLWQGALICICLRIVLRALSNVHARLRYHCSIAALLLLMGAFITTWIGQWQQLQSVTVWVRESGKDTDIQTLRTIAVQPSRPATDVWLTYPFPGMERAFPWLVAAYGLGILVMLIRFLIGFMRIYRLRNRNILLPEAMMLDLFQRMKERLQINSTIRLLMSSTVQVPMVSGFFRPIILLPVSIHTGLSVNQLEAILLHELAHIKRQDYLINILQIIIETILFFNPFLWWISAGIRQEREHCCDDLVLAETLQPLPYASALAALEANRYASPMPALAATGSKHQLFHRIKRFTEMKRIPLSYGRLTAAIITVCAITGAVIWFTPAFAQDKKNKPSTSTTSSKTIQKVIVIDDQGNKQEYNSIDELPADTKHRVDEAMEEKNFDLDGLAGLDKLPEGLDTLIDGKQIHTIVMNAMNSVDWKNIDKTTHIAMLEADKAMKQADREMKKVDWDKIDAEIDRAMDEVDRVDWDAVAAASKDGKTGRELRIEVRKQVEEAKEEAREAVENARQAREEARRVSRYSRRELPEPPAPPAAPNNAEPPAPPSPPAPTNYNRMLSEMERDGLIDKGRGFTIRKNSSDLYINGEAQPDNVKVKYRHYFSPGKVNISGSKNNLSVQSIR